MADRLTTMNVSIPASLRAFVRTRMREAGFANVSEYIRHLVREDQKAASHDRLEALLREGLESGPGVPVTPRYWADLRRRVGARVEAQKPRRKAG